MCVCALIPFSLGQHSHSRSCTALCSTCWDHQPSQSMPLSFLPLLSSAVYRLSILIDSFWPLLAFVLLPGIVSVHRHDSLASFTGGDLASFSADCYWLSSGGGQRMGNVWRCNCSLFLNMISYCLSQADRDSLYLLPPLIRLNLALITIDPRAPDSLKVAAIQWQTVRQRDGGGASSSANQLARNKQQSKTHTHTAASSFLLSGFLLLHCHFVVHAHTHSHRSEHTNAQSVAL